MQYRFWMQLIGYCFIFKHGIDSKHMGNTVKAYLDRKTHNGHCQSWIGLQCGIILTEWNKRQLKSKEELWKTFQKPGELPKESCLSELRLCWRIKVSKSYQILTIKLFRIVQTVLLIYILYFHACLHISKCTYFIKHNRQFKTFAQYCESLISLSVLR